MKFKTATSIAFKLYAKDDSDYQSSIFDLIEGKNETKQTKGLAYLLKSDKSLLEEFLSINKIMNSINKLNITDEAKNADYIEVVAEMLSERVYGNYARRDITIYFYKNNTKIFYIVIEGKSIISSSTGDIENQLTSYFDKRYYPHDYPNGKEIPHIGITLTKTEELLKNPSFISITWMDVIDMLSNFIKSNKNDIIQDYFNFITGVDKNMKFYEADVISIPAGETSELIKKYSVHSCPNRYHYKRKPLFLTFRKTGGFMERLYKNEDVIILDPRSPSLKKEIRGYPYAKRLLGYIEAGFQKKNFFNNDKDKGKWRFYILSESNQIELKARPKPSSPLRGHTYFTLSSILSGDNEIEICKD